MANKRVGFTTAIRRRIPRSSSDSQSIVKTHLSLMRFHRQFAHELYLPLVVVCYPSPSFRIADHFIGQELFSLGNESIERVLCASHAWWMQMGKRTEKQLKTNTNLVSLPKMRRPARCAREMETSESQNTKANENFHCFARSTIRIDFYLDL